MATRLREISKNIEDAEFKNALADLMSQLAEAKIDAAQAKEKLATLMTENVELKATLESQDAPDPDPPIGKKWGLYQFEGEQGLFCTACWETEKRKSSTTRLSGGFRKCPVCGAEFGR